MTFHDTNACALMAVAPTVAPLPAGAAQAQHVGESCFFLNPAFLFMTFQFLPARSRPGARLAVLRRACRTGLLAAVLAVIGTPAAMANGVGENGAWQFQTSADKVNQAAVQDMIQKRNMGYYTAPVYTTNIDRQINCNQSANAHGNDSNQGAAALSPSNSGATSGATGNANTSTGGSGGSKSQSDQANSGSVGAGVHGNTNTQVSGEASQALNSRQHNSGSQTASLASSTGCTFGVLN